MNEDIERHMVELTNRQVEAVRQVEIALSPLEKFLQRRVKVSTYDRAWIGELTSFGGGWVQLGEADDALIIYTGVGLLVELSEDR